ncbi:hypothetical protein Ahy_A06g028738 [Arachis hypogaea]|uniref:FAR1 domain-containing protein n=1 Tax=Arachis hypogaea TaxID=3818 RepID=A0A445CRJ4_ARAHY|nr:hypothetical protein Ahy_A06g028738 [Arachis hypogaea]
MTFKTLEKARKLYKSYSKLANFSTKIKNMTRKGDKIKNQLFICSREGRWKSKISQTLKTDPSAGINCLARIYGYRDVHANNNSPVVHLAHHEEDPKQTKQLQVTQRNRTRDEPRHLELVHKRRIRQKLERFSHKHMYTHEKFREVQGQLRGKVNYIKRLMHSTLGFTTYEVVEQVYNSTFNNITRSKVLVPAVRVKGHTMPPFPERLKLRASR